VGCRWAPRGAPWLPGFREASRFSGSHGRGFLAFENDRGNLGGHRVLEICFRDAGQTIRGSQYSKRFDVVCCLWAPGCTTGRIRTCRSFWQSTAPSSMCAALPCQALSPIPCQSTSAPLKGLPGPAAHQHRLGHLTALHCICVAPGEQRDQVLLARKSLRKVCWSRCHQVLVVPVPLLASGALCTCRASSLHVPVPRAVRVYPPPRAGPHLRLRRNTAIFSTEEKDLDRTDYPPEKLRYLESLSPSPSLSVVVVLLRLAACSQMGRVSWRTGMESSDAGL